MVYTPSPSLPIPAPHIMGKKRILLTVALMTLPLVACQNTANTTKKPREVSTVSLDSVAARPLGESEWNALRVVMTPAEKAAFDRAVAAEDKLRYVRLNGIDVRLLLNEKLREGMSESEVNAVLHGIADRQELGDSREGWVHAAVFNGETTTIIDLQFDPKSGALKHWASHVANAGRQAETIEAALQGRLDRVLRKGMMQPEITESYNRALAMRGNIEAKMSERRNDPNYTGTRTASEGGFNTEAARERAGQVVRFWEVLNRKPTYIRREGAWEYWYHRIDLEGRTDKFVVVEYRFINKLLDSWYVYSTDFLGFEGLK